MRCILKPSLIFSDHKKGEFLIATDRLAVVLLENI